MSESLTSQSPLARVAERPRADQWADDEEMLLAEFIAVFYPRGPLTVSSLRTEIRKGRLIPAQVAGKLFITPSTVRGLFRRSTPCPAPEKVCASTSAAAESIGAPAAPSPTPGSSSTDRERWALASLESALQTLSAPSPPMSRKGMRLQPPPRPQAEVIQLRS